MAKVLVVEDDRYSREFLTRFLRREGYTVDEADDGDVGLQLAAQADIILLDVMMPKLDGWEVMKTLRKDYPWIPVIMLTALASSGDQVHGFDLGADDYVTKPYDLRTLGSRIKALLRRVGHKSELVFGSLKIIPESHEVFMNEVAIPLARVEFELFLALVQHPGQVFTRERLLERIWGRKYFGNARVVDVRLVALRKKLGGGEFIETVWGSGYRFNEAAVPAIKPEVSE
jgi:two-component system, OmpR family, alkaline phosphatase synthesis response regulator PhoP